MNKSNKNAQKGNTFIFMVVLKMLYCVKVSVDFLDYPTVSLVK